ncbi:MAG: YdeI/OmpD-associated family protein [Candidatus Aminicenantales bacterium]
MKYKIFRDASGWRTWLENNHDTAKEIWLAYYKKNSGKTSLTYQEALEEALCFGWIDSIVRRIDAEKYGQRWTPRNKKSIWSAANKKRLDLLRKEGRLAPAGLRKIEAAKKNGSWKRLDGIERLDKGGVPPSDLIDALNRRPDVRETWDRLAPSRKKLWSWWVESAKRPETRTRRLAAVIEGVAEGRSPGM